MPGLCLPKALQPFLPIFQQVFICEFSFIMVYAYLNFECKKVQHKINFRHEDIWHICIELQGLISGSAETKEQAAEGLGELIDVTSEKTLKEVIVPITGYVFYLLEIASVLWLPFWMFHIWGFVLFEGSPMSLQPWGIPPHVQLTAKQLLSILYSFKARP